MLDSIAAWFVAMILNWLLGKATAAVQDEVDQVALDKERDEINQKNMDAYEAAKDRQSRIQAALNLLNRDTTP